MTIKRREFLGAAAGALGLALAPAVLARPAAKKILFFTKSSGFQHSVIARKGEELGHAEKILQEIGKAKGFEVTCSKDGKLFEPDQIGEWDAFAFYTTGDLSKPGTDKSPPISKQGEEAFYAAVAGGKGFMGMHCATDTFGQHRGIHKNDPYITLIGGEFIGHGAQQVATLNVADEKFPGAAGFGSVFEINDEWYGQRNLGDDLHVIISHKTQGMQGNDYNRPDYPQTWCRMQDKGRVFYTSMGHREDVWTNEKYQALLIGALLWITGQVEADVTPNISKVTPGYATLPPGKK